jgi:threonine aldolase
MKEQKTTRYIDLRSDTVTQPTQEMRDAMYKAPVGDDVYQDDPTTNELERVAAEILGKEAAIFVTSGTMGNQLAIMSQTRRGDEIIVGAQAHIHMHEVGAAAVLSGVNQRILYYPDCMPDEKMIENAIRPDDIHEPPTALICVENALANGRVVPPERMKKIYRLARRHKLPVHLDGARIFNAAVALGVDVRELTQYCDTVSCCLSKGLCAPVGSVLAGPKAVIDRARKYRKMLGGGMRQNGILAAAGLIAITEMPKRLHIDHENARYLADRLETVPGVHVCRDRLDIDMVFFNVDAPQATVDALPERMLRRGVKVGGYEEGAIRWVTNRDVSRKDIDAAVAALDEALAE